MIHRVRGKLGPFRTKVRIGDTRKSQFSITLVGKFEKSANQPQTNHKNRLLLRSLLKFHGQFSEA